MADVSFLSWPFFTDAHRALARDFDAWCEREIVPLEGREDQDLDGTCREIVRRLGADGWLRHAVAEHDRSLDVRALCLIRETLGRYCVIVELGRVEEGDAVRWIQEYCGTRDVKIDPDASRELVDSLGGDMMMISNELEKLILYVGEKKRVTLGDVETMVLAAKQRSLYELTDAISARDRVASRVRTAPSGLSARTASAPAGSAGVNYRIVWFNVFKNNTKLQAAPEPVTIDALESRKLAARVVTMDKYDVVDVMVRALDRPAACLLSKERRTYRRTTVSERSRSECVECHGTDRSATYRRNPFDPSIQQIRFSLVARVRQRGERRDSVIHCGALDGDLGSGCASISRRCALPELFTERMRIHKIKMSVSETRVFEIEQPVQRP